MTKFYETEEFRRLQKEWDSRLSDSGFVDLEQRHLMGGCEGRYLLGMSSGDLCRRLFKAETADYYRAARQHAWEMPHGVPRHIWELHAEGLSVSKIVRSLKPWYGCGRKKVTRILRDERGKMARAWAEEAQTEYDSRHAEVDR